VANCGQTHFGRCAFVRLGQLCCDDTACGFRILLPEILLIY